MNKNWFTGNSLIFIGEMPDEKVMRIKSKPEFYDAVILSKQSPRSIKNAPYQFIPLGGSIHFCENDVKFTFHQHSLQIMGNQQLTETDVYNILNHFAVKKGNQISFLVHFPSDKYSEKKQETKS